MDPKKPKAGEKPSKKKEPKPPLVRQTKTSSLRNLLSQQKKADSAMVRPITAPVAEAGASTSRAVRPRQREEVARNATEVARNAIEDAAAAEGAASAQKANDKFKPATNNKSSVKTEVKTKDFLAPECFKNLQLDSFKPEQKPKKNDKLSPKRELYPSKKIELGWKKTGHWSVGAGMVNMGNSCYMNSILQALFHVPSLVNWLMADTEHSSACWESSCIICAMRNTLMESQRPYIVSFRPEEIYDKLQLICSNLIPKRQEDAHEFFRGLIESMEKCYWQRFDDNAQFDLKVRETSPLNRIFGGYLRSVVTCLSCGHVSTTRQLFQDLMVDIEIAQNLEEALDLYFREEKLECYECESCHGKAQATKQFRLDRAPLVLCIQLMRFSFVNEKITKHVDFKERLNISQYASRKPNVPLNYRLVAIITHLGQSVNLGHYTTVARTASGDFFLFNDEEVKSLTQEALLNTNAYIMLYEMVAPSSRKA